MQIGHQNVQRIELNSVKADAADEDHKDIYTTSIIAP